MNPEELTRSRGAVDERRRDLLKKALVGGGLAVAAPIVTTLGVPAAAAGSANSCRFVFTCVGGGLLSCTPTGWAGAVDGTAADQTAEGLTFTCAAGNNTATINLAATSDFNITAFQFERSNRTPGTCYPTTGGSITPTKGPVTVNAALFGGNGGSTLLQVFVVITRA